jgi:hypothetical protein
MAMARRPGFSFCAHDHEHSRYINIMELAEEVSEDDHLKK